MVISSCLLYSCSPASDDDPVVPPVEIEKPIVRTVSVNGLGYDSIIVTGVITNNTKINSCGVKYSSYIKDGSVEGALAGDTFKVKMAIQPGITYSVYAFAKNNVGTGNGEWVKYTYSAGKPKMSTPSAIEVTDVSGVACDTIDNGNLPTTVTIYYGSSSVYTDSMVINTYNKKTVVKFSFPGLESGTEHHFCFKAENVLGTLKTSDVVFYTGVKDIDGNFYPVVRMGDQLCITKDLMTTHYNDGTPIPNPISDADWKAAGDSKTGAYCYYNNDPEIGKIYGALYNWYAIATGKLAPKGWHVPSYEEFMKIIVSYGLEHNLATEGYLKETGNEHWKSPNVGATNASGFTALPNGGRYYTASPDDGVLRFSDLHLSAVWWTADEFIDGFTRILYMDYDTPDCFNDHCDRNMYGLGVRIVKDSK